METNKENITELEGESNAPSDTAGTKAAESASNANNQADTADKTVLAEETGAAAQAAVNTKANADIASASAPAGGAKIAVVYRSMTGHSKKIASAVAKEFGVAAVNVKKERPEFKDVDLMFFVGGLYSGKSLPEAMEFIKGLKPENVKRAALITTSVKGGGQDEVRAALSNAGIEVADEYRAHGNFLFLKLGHPNKAEIAGAVEFAKRLC